MLETNSNVQIFNAETQQKTVRVLVVAAAKEDFAFLKTLIGESLYNHHYIVEWVNNYATAINAMLKKHHDLYLVDYKLGDYSGLTLLHEAIRSNCTDPIIMLSSKTDVHVDREALRIGATSFLVKDGLEGHALERSMRYAIEQSGALKSLKKNENKFRVLFEKSKSPILITDSSGRIYDANPASVRFFGLPLEKLIASNDQSFFAEEEERRRFIQSLEDKGSVNDMEITLRLPNGQTKFCSISSFVQISQHATSILYYSIITDLTSIKENESIMAEKMAISEHIVKNLATEIQDPLSNVNLALLELTTNLNGKNESLKPYLDIVKENFNRIDQLTRKLCISVDRAKDIKAGAK